MQSLTSTHRLSHFVLFSSPLVAGLLFLRATFACAAAIEIPNYQAGDEVGEDLVTPVNLVVVNPVATQERRSKAAARVPAVYRFDPMAADAVEEKFRVSFARTREAFGETVQTVYKKRLLSPAALEEPRFLRLLGSFQRKHRGFPMQTNLFHLWALGQSDVLFEAELVSKLRATMRQYLREGAQTAEAKIGPGQVQMILSGATPAGMPLTLSSQSLLVARSNVTTLYKAKAELAKTFAADEQGVAKYLASFLRTNCIFDEPLTRETRRRKVEGIYATDHYEAGQPVLKRGQRIDGVALAALDELRSKTMVDHVRAEAARERLAAETAQARLRDAAALATRQAQNITTRNRWLVGGLGATTVLLLSAVALLMHHRRKSNSLLPVLGHGNGSTATIACPSCNEPVAIPLPPVEEPLAIGGMEDEVPVGAMSDDHAEHWKKRALRAEGHARKANAVVRAGLLPYLARWMMNKLVSGLVSDRRRLLAVQTSAADDVAALERRLGEMQAPLRDRLSAYERRIGELERELALKGEENRELIKAKIVLARQQLERERSKESASLN